MAPAQAEGVGGGLRCWGGHRTLLGGAILALLPLAILGRTFTGGDYENQWTEFFWPPVASFPFFVVTSCHRAHGRWTLESEGQ